MKVKVISLPCIPQVVYVLCFTGPRYQVSVYRTIGPLVYLNSQNNNVVSVLLSSIKSIEFYSFKMYVVQICIRLNLP